MPIKSCKPLVSFIIPCYNSAGLLDKSLQTIIREKELFYPNMEIIVIDGGSNDNTVEIIRKHDNRITYWISEKDEGPADAFNKGLRIAQGKYIRFMSADDEILLGKTIDLVNYLEKHNRVAIVAGQFEMFYNHAELANRTVYPRIDNERRIHFLDIALWGTMPGPTPECCLFRTDIFHSVGLWDVKYRYASDLAFWFKAIKHKQVIVILPIIVLRRFANPNSLTNVYQNQVVKHTRDILKNEAGAIFSYIFELRYNYMVRKVVETPFKLLGLHPVRAWKYIRDRIRLIK